MRAFGRLGRQGWRGVVAVAFAATAVLAVAVSRGAPAHVALASSRHPSRALGASGAAQCATSRLRISLTTGSGPGARASAGHARSADAGVSTLEFTNVSGVACALSGYPGVAAYGAGGAQIGNAAGRDTSVTARRIVLAPGATAHAAVAASVSAGSCRPVVATGLRVVPPGQSVARYIRHAIPACGLAGRRAPVFLHVRAVQPG